MKLIKFINANPMEVKVFKKEKFGFSLVYSFAKIFSTYFVIYVATIT